MSGGPGWIDPAPILVAIDGDAPGWEALCWAALEASARRCPLRIVHIFKWPPFTWDAFGYVHINQWCPDAYDAAQGVLDAARDRALQISPELRITTQMEAGSVVTNVLRAQMSDAMLVIGRRRPVGQLRPTPWSVSWQLARRSKTPVVLVAASLDTAPAPSAGPVVVVVEDLEGAFDAVAFALATATRWGVGVTALATRQSQSNSHAEASWGRWSVAFPDVHVRRLVTGSLRKALNEESRGASLVVAGGHHRGLIHSAFIGSLDGEVVREADGPIAFVRSQARRPAPRLSTFPHLGSLRAQLVRFTHVCYSPKSGRLT